MTKQLTPPEKGSPVYCKACVSIHRKDQELIKDFCAHRATNDGFKGKATSTLQGELSQFAGFVLARGRSLRDVENDDIAAFLKLQLSKGGNDAVVAGRQSKLRSFYRWLLQNNKIKRVPTEVRRQLSFSWETPNK
ncbi:MAG: site-specific integrase [Terracidiphilus sp.]